MSNPEPVTVQTPPDGGPAFPETRWQDDLHQEVQWCGMSLLDYFAAKAMQAAFGCEMIVEVAASKGTKKGSEMADAIARFAYEMADAMLKEKSNRHRR